MIFWKHILDKLEGGNKVYLLTVIDNIGSSPGRKGFKMLVSEDGFIFGSIGGGIMEVSLVDEAKLLLLQEESPVLIKKQIHRGFVKDGSGMICSGEQTVAFYPLNSVHLVTVQNIIDRLKNGTNGVLNLRPESISFTENNLAEQFESKIISKSNWLFKEQIGFKEMLYIIGGGHVGAALAELFEKLGFYVIVIDNRENINTFENNPYAHQKLRVDYNDINEYVSQGDSNYVAIMSNKYTDDKLLLSKLIKNNYKYIGVLGSKAKLKTMWKDLIKEGFSKEELNSIYAPIGLPIKSETPKEIAVSIAAQIIQLKNENKK